MEIALTTLRKAHDNGQIDQFVQEHADDPAGDADRFNATLQAMARKSKAVPVTSNEAGSDD
jgi:hypothetical protein